MAPLLVVLLLPILLLPPALVPASAAQLRQEEPWVQQISGEPRAYVYHNFLSAEEADHLVALARPHLAKSKVVVGETGHVADSTARTSSGAWIARGQDAVVASIEQRIADWTGAPVDHAEPLHVLHYAPSEEYQEHIDFFLDERSKLNGGQRVATVLLYLSDVPEGGETVFPNSKLLPTEEQEKELSVCARRGAAAKARKGDALLFFNQLPDGSLDWRSAHAGCPVLAGEKLVATKWLREAEWIDAPLAQLGAVRAMRAQAAAQQQQQQ